RAALDQRDVQAQLSGHDASDMGGLNEMLEYVLPVRRAVAQPSQQLHQFRVDLGDAHLDERVFGGAQAQLLDFATGGIEDLFDAVRVYPPVEHEPFQREPADLSPHRVETGEQDGFGCVVDDEVDAG